MDRMDVVVRMVIGRSKTIEVVKVGSYTECKAYLFDRLVDAVPASITTDYSYDNGMAILCKEEENGNEVYVQYYLQAVDMQQQDRR